MPPGEDECRARINASKLTPNLSELEKSLLIQDAIRRAEEAGQYIEMDDYMKGVLYGNYNGEKHIVPIIEPIRFVSKASVDGMEQVRDDDDCLSEVREESNSEYER